MTPEPRPWPTSIWTTAGLRALATCSTLDWEPGSAGAATVGVVADEAGDEPCCQMTAPAAPITAAATPMATQVRLRDRGFSGSCVGGPRQREAPRHRRPARSGDRDRAGAGSRPPAGWRAGPARCAEAAAPGSGSCRAARSQARAVSSGGHGGEGREVGIKPMSRPITWRRPSPRPSSAARPAIRRRFAGALLAGSVAAGGSGAREYCTGGPLDGRRWPSRRPGRGAGRCGGGSRRPPRRAPGGPRPSAAATR